jgi:hypothetical protein
MGILCLYCISPIIIPFGLDDLLLGIICKELYVLYSLALLACARTSLLVVLLLRPLYGAQASRDLGSASLQSHSSTHPSQVAKAYSKILINNKTILCSLSLFLLGFGALRFVFLQQILTARRRRHQSEQRMSCSSRN